MRTHEVRIHHSISELQAEEWRPLEDPDSPFADYEFLQTLEDAGCVGPEAGQVPLYLTLRENGALVGAAPLYVKSHSYGEYIFDWAWADAAGRAGIPYYPKLVCYIPFSPVSCRKLLTSTHRRELVEEIRKFAEGLDVQSTHFLFTTEDEQPLLANHFLLRHSFQYHWPNRNYRSFDDFLGGLKSRKAKQIRKERACLGGLQVEALEGRALTPAKGAAFYQFYLSTIEDKSSIPYLNQRFFELLFARMPDRLLLVQARDGAEVIAQALFLHKGSRLFGRYWGALRQVECLHFELCYYQGMEYAIRNKLRIFEAGAQGEHKLVRGFTPTLTYSAHDLRHPGLRAAVGQFIQQERTSVARDLGELATYLPYRVEENKLKG